MPRPGSKYALTERAAVPGRGIVGLKLAQPFYFFSSEPDEPDRPFCWCRRVRSA